MADQISEFSRQFSAALRGVMAEGGISVAAVAKRLGRSTGFVSMHTNGSAPPDTDLIDAVAELFEVNTAALVREIADRIGRQWAEDAVRFLEEKLDGVGPPAGSAARDELNRRRIASARRQQQVESDPMPTMDELAEEPSAAFPVRPDVEGDEEPPQP